MTVPKAVAGYAIVGTLAAFLLTGKRKKTTRRMSSAIGFGLLAAAAAFVAPQLGVSLPGVPALPAGARRA